MTDVKPKENESLEAMIKRFNKKVGAAGIIQEVRNRQAYEKPSDIKRKARAAGKARCQKEQLKIEKELQFHSENKVRPPRQFDSKSSSKAPERGGYKNPAQRAAEAAANANKPKVEAKPQPKKEFKPRSKPKAKVANSKSLQDLQDKFNK